jgi:hypothetical protein
MKGNKVKYVPDSMSLDHARPPARVVYPNLAAYRKAEALRWKAIRKDIAIRNKNEGK